MAHGSEKKGCQGPRKGKFIGVKRNPRAEPRTRYSLIPRIPFTLRFTHENACMAGGTTEKSPTPTNTPHIYPNKLVIPDDTG